MSRNNLLLLLLLATLLATSCLPSRQDLHYYVPTISVPEKNTDQQLTLLENVRLPGYLDRHEMTYLDTSGELKRLPKVKWAQPLGSLVKDALVAATRQRANYATSTPFKANLTLDQFVMLEDGSFLVAGMTECRNPQLPNPTRKEFHFTLPSLGRPTVAHLVTQTNNALARLLTELQSH